MPDAPAMAQVEPVAPTAAPEVEAANDRVYQPPAANDPFYAPTAPLHTQTQSTLAPTSEYVRYLLLALPARYIPRGIFGTLFDTDGFKSNGPAKWLANIGASVQKKFKLNPEQPKQAKHASALTYNAVMGVGSLALTATYSWTVYKDIKNIFSEAVGEELCKPASQITRKDLANSDNRIVQKTMENFWKRLIKRTLTDLLFFPAAALRNEHLGDLMVGGKALEAFAETWKRKTTMFEDLVTFINNKINPRNGLGQAINVGEIFDLYQHYTEAFHPDKMFTNVLERGTGEGARWAENQPIFERITELMNLTYAYKHRSEIDPKTGHAIHRADFALPKLIYLLGHDLIDVQKPEQTLATIEIANKFGIPAVKEMQAMLGRGASLQQVTERFPIPAPHTADKPKLQNGKNGVIAKGSTMQLDTAPEISVPANRIDASSIRDPAMALKNITSPQLA